MIKRNPECGYLCLEETVMLIKNGNRYEYIPEVRDDFTYRRNTVLVMTLVCLAFWSLVVWLVV
jgi:hypothetical protein